MAFGLKYEVIRVWREGMAEDMPKGEAEDRCVAIAERLEDLGF